MGALNFQHLYRTIVWKRMCIPRVEMWIQLIVRTTLVGRGSSYRAISHELLHVSCSTFANRMYSLDGFLDYLFLQLPLLLHRMSQGDFATVIETNFSLDEIETII